MNSLESALRLSRSVALALPGPGKSERMVYRLPLLAYRLGMGEMLDRVYIAALTTRGRKTGQPRTVALEYRLHGSKVYILSGWGEHAHWVRNLQQDPQVTLRRGLRAQAAQAEVVDDRNEAFRALSLFYRTNPRGYERMFRRLSQRDSTDALTLPQIADRVLVVRVRPEAGPPVLPPAPAGRPEIAAAVGAGVLLGLFVWLLALAVRRLRA